MKKFLSSPGLLSPFTPLLSQSSDARLASPHNPHSSRSSLTTPPSSSALHTVTRSPRISLPSPVTPSRALYFGDVGSFDAYLQVPFEEELKSAVREANDACLWLKAAGFPQYVQIFQEGQFPINLSKCQVEKDHSFLDQAAIDSLIRRLNILNRCADLMEEVHAKDDESEDETTMRALSDHWHFKKKKWSRKRQERKSDFSRSFDDLLSDADETPTEQSPLMLVSELRGSLTDLDRRVKTYSFLPSEEQASSIVIAITPAEENGEEEEATKPVDDDALYLSNSEGFHEDDACPLAWAGHGGEDVCNIPNTDMDTFATGILDTFESNLKKLHIGEVKSHSLPDVFSASQYSEEGMEYDLALSSSSTSTVSILEGCKHSEDEFELNSSVYHGLNGSPTKKNGLMNGHVVQHDRDSSDDRSYGNRVGSAVGSSGDSECCESESSPLFASVKKSASNGDFPGSIDLTSPSATLTRSTGQNGSESHRHLSSAKWHSFQRAHSFQQACKPIRIMIPIEELSVGQISVLRKLSLVKLTALIELHKTKSNIARILKSRKTKHSDIRNKNVFGVPLSSNVRQHGQPLPPTILQALAFLREEGLETTGLFRRAASKAKVEALKELHETDPKNASFDDFSAYDVADMVKLYFRELPEPLLTSKLSETLIVIQENIPSQLRLQALQAVMLLMPDENREALQTFLCFLKDVASNSSVNQMDAQNVAVCLAPTLFSLSSGNNPSRPSSLVRRGSFRKNAVNHHSPTSLALTKEVTDSVASSRCLSQMIKQADKLFMVAADMMQVCKFTHLEFGDPVPCHELGMEKCGMGNFLSYLDDSVTTMLKEARRKFKGWVHYDSTDGVDVSYLKINDGVPLRLWRGVIEIAASCDTVLNKLWDQSYIWDGRVDLKKVVEKIDSQTEVVQYISPAIPPLTNRDHCLLRSWQHDTASDSYVLVSTSVSHPSASLQAGIRATELATRYLIEPLPAGNRCRLTFVARVDIRGRAAEYYNRMYGPYLVSTVSRLRDSFQERDFQETPV